MKVVNLTCPVISGGGFGFHGLIKAGVGARNWGWMVIVNALGHKFIPPARSDFLSGVTWPILVRKQFQTASHRKKQTQSR